MREAANDAQKHGVLPNANKSVQRACEIHKKRAERKKWTVTTEKRTAKAIKEKTNRQKQNFMKELRQQLKPNRNRRCTNPSSMKDKRPQESKKAARGERRRR
jgi:hypothetical protein